MGNQLLVRAYNVGCGDCIYVRIPDTKDGFHMLIDCGKKGGDGLLEKAVKHIEANLLPPGSAPGKKRLDLIVATHRHEDHIKGFDVDWFANIEVKNIWLSVAMDPKNPQAVEAKGLHDLANTAMRSLAASGRELSPEAELLASLYPVSNDEADKLLLETLPQAHGITPQFVHSGLSAKDVGLKLPADTMIHVLAPERDIDHFYLGEAVSTTLKGLQGGAAAFASDLAKPAQNVPKNIDAAAFRLLQLRMLSNGLAFAAKDSSIQNNLSVVLLIEWKGRRLLFVGDAEWDGEFKVGKDNGSWNVMWEKHRATHLSKPVDFLKIGHHGSINATPPPASLRKPRKVEPPAGASVYDILETILPVPAAGQAPSAQALVSTEREFYNPIPECALLVDLARRVSNTRTYGSALKTAGVDVKSIWTSEKAKKNKFFETYEQAFLDEPQPLRTDLEFQLSGADFVDVEIAP